MTPEVLHRADATPDTCAALSELCLRSKALWGYDAAFMEACRAPLTVTPASFDDHIAVCRAGAAFSAFLHLRLHGPDPEIAKLFVSPDHMRQGLGAALMIHAKARARDAGVSHLRIESDPQAMRFYASHGAVQIGSMPSEAIPGRDLPLLRLPTTA